jgi:hypothetical protein
MLLKLWFLPSLLHCDQITTFFLLLNISWVNGSKVIMRGKIKKLQHKLNDKVDSLASNHL